MAHTITSTNPRGKMTSLITSSVTSVGTFADFFGQETQIIPSCLILSMKLSILAVNSDLLLVKK
jgi:hypothetical protein